MSISGHKRLRVNSSDDDNIGYLFQEVHWGLNAKDEKMVPLDNAIYTVGTEIHFTCQIDSVTIEQLIKEITTIINDNLSKYSGTDEKLTISIIVDSGGGSVTSTAKFVDALALARSKYPFVEFVTIASGLICSAATIVCVVGDKRYMTKNAHAMIHELSSGFNGKFTHLNSHNKFLNDLHEMLVRIYMEKTGIGRSKLEDLLAKETWLTAEQYLELGFIDKILG